MPFSRWTILALLPLVGCATWSSQNDAGSGLPGPRMARDSVVLEVTFVQVPTGDPNEWAFWTQVDEQHIPIDVHRRLQENGMRTGLVGAHVPDELRRLLDKSPQTLELLAAGMSPGESELFAQQKRLQIRAGERHPVRVTPDSPEAMVVLLSEQENVRAQRFGKPVGFFAIKTFALGDGRVRLELTPEVEYGDMRQRFVGGPGTLLVKNSRERHVFQRLGMSTIMSPGQTLVVTSTPQPRGLGEQFFAPAASSDRGRTLMLIRLAQTQFDDLFCPGEGLGAGERAENELLELQDFE